MLNVAFFIVMLNVIVPSDFMVNVVMLSVVALLESVVFVLCVFANENAVNFACVNNP
jgi:hypothetical protein